MDDKLVIFFDGACSRSGTSHGRAAFGWIAKRNGATVATGKGPSPGHVKVTNQTAEYSGLLAALRWLVESGHQGAVEVRGDAQLVFRQMTGEYSCGAEHLQPLHRAALELAYQLPGAVSFRWVPRAENTEADALASAAFDEMIEAQAGSGGDGYTGQGDPVAIPLGG